MKTQLKKASLENRTIEICGFIGRKDGNLFFELVRNNHPQPHSFFEISPLDYLSFKRKYELVAVFHSHVCGDSLATDFDKKHAMNLCLPFYIYSVPENKFSLYTPENSKVNLKEEDFDNY